MAKKKTTKLSIRLLKPAVQSPIDAIKEDQDKLEPILLDGNPQDKFLWAGQVYGGDPSWFDFFNPADVVKLKEKKIFGAGGGAVLFVRVVDTLKEQQNEIDENDTEAEEVSDNAEEEPTYRWIAVCFGMGYHALQQDKIEPNFGTIVALNKIGQDLIRSIDTKRPEDATIQTRIQNSKRSDIFDFGIDTNRIILHSITGESDDKDFATTLTGSEGLSINTEVNYNSVAVKCQQIYDAYLLKDYETRAPWYGKILPVKDQIKIDALNADLVNRLNSENASQNVHMAPPDIIDYQDIGKFRYSGQNLESNRSRDAQDGFDELDVDDFISRVKAGETITLEMLNKCDVQISSGENGSFKNKWTIYKCLICEIQTDNNSALHVLSNGEWYEISTDFVQEINAAMEAIPVSSFRLPNFDDGEHTEVKKGKICLSEGAYNADIARNLSTQYLLCDKRNIHFSGESGPVEFCDLFSVNKKIIHVKMRGASAHLSHHFMQGYVSARAFKNSQEFRTKIREKMTAAQSYIPERQIDCRDYEIVFAFIQHNQKYIPFFSRVALRSVHQMIRDMDYPVSILWIDRNKIADTNIDEDEEGVDDAEYQRTA